MLLDFNDFKKYETELGTKTLNLKVLHDLGLNVPRFLAIPSSVVLQINHDENVLSIVIKEILEKLPVAEYAVRSSALIEDGQQSSFAGQFSTEIQVKPEALAEAIKSVIEQSKDILGDHLENFSLIIQEYMAADYAGIVFTRNPAGSRTMVVEYHQGIGEDLVSGKVKAEHLEFTWQDGVKNHFLSEQIDNFKKIENHFAFPQDIEFCLSGGIFYFLQARPISTIDENVYAAIKYLDEFLPKAQNFYYAKTEISEIAPRPSLLTLDLLKKIYAANGPVAAVYKKNGIKYQNTNFLKIIGNELFVDKEKEMQAVFPAYTYLKNDNYEAKFVFFQHNFLTIKNLLALVRFKNDKKYLLTKVQAELAKNWEEKDLESLLKKFLIIYEWIFEINLIAANVFKKLENLLRSENIAFADLMMMSRTGDFANDLRQFNFKADSFQGNSLEFFDDSEFFQSEKKAEANQASQWWTALSSFKKNYFRQAIYEALYWEDARELGRALTVKGISAMRQSFKSVQASLSKADYIYFFTFDEILSGNLSDIVAKNRYDQYMNFNHFNFDNIYTGKVRRFNNEALQGISSGVAKGRLVLVDEIERISGDKILFTKTLSPRLTKYFGQINGILTEQGAYLSHLAIIAREKSLPIISNCFLNEEKLVLGDFIEMDAGQGIIKKINN